MREYLVARGVDIARLTPRGFGSEMPIADPDDPDSARQNRRIDFIVQGPDGRP